MFLARHRKAALVVASPPALVSVRDQRAAIQEVEREAKARLVAAERLSAKLEAENAELRAELAALREAASKMPTQQAAQQPFNQHRRR